MSKGINAQGSDCARRYDEQVAPSHLRPTIVVVVTTWIRRVRLSVNARVCSDHFVFGKKLYK